MKDTKSMKVFEYCLILCFLCLLWPTIRLPIHYAPHTAVVYHMRHCCEERVFERRGNHK